MGRHVAAAADWLHGVSPPAVRLHAYARRAHSLGGTATGGDPLHQTHPHGHAVHRPLVQRRLVCTERGGVVSASLQKGINALREVIDAPIASFFSSCVHCGMCADACLFFTETRDPKYTPIHKLEPLRRVWK